MRDSRFVAEHRGGPLSKRNHQLLSIWAADCAEHVLPLFVGHSDDKRPQVAITTARMWANEKIAVGEAQKASIASHSAARQESDAAAVAVARAAGQAVATAHFADHCLGAAVYALKAVAASNGDVEAERAWQLRQLPSELSELVQSALQSERIMKISP